MIKWCSPLIKTSDEFFFLKEKKKATAQLIDIKKLVFVAFPVKSPQFDNSCSIVLLYKFHIAEHVFKLLPYLPFVIYLCVYFPFLIFSRLLIGSKHFKFQASLGKGGVCLLKYVCSRLTAFKPFTCSLCICDMSYQWFFFTAICIRTRNLIIMIKFKEKSYLLFF